MNLFGLKNTEGDKKFRNTTVKKVFFMFLCSVNSMT